jgi:hypothetical protein
LLAVLLRRGKEEFQSMSVFSKITSPFRLGYTLVRRFAVSVRPWKPNVKITSQGEMARLVDQTIHHQIRAGRTHRFIDILFVTVDDRVFCRRYTYGERSWRDVFLSDPDGQLSLDGAVVDIEGRVPDDLDAINTLVNAAYRARLDRIGARWMVDGAVEERAMASTMEMRFAPQGC